MPREPCHFESRETRRTRLQVRWWGVLVIFTAGMLGIAVAEPAQADKAGAHRAGVVVRSGDGSVRTACVTFAEPSISGLALLERSGLDLTVQASGGNATVCSIAGEGCRFPTQGCFCQCQGGGPCRYWAYWHLNGGIWQYASTGAAAYRVPPGGVDGWAWGDGNVNSGAQPPPTSFEAVCRLPAPTAIATDSTRPQTTTANTATPTASVSATPAAPSTTTLAMPSPTAVTEPAGAAPPARTNRNAGQYLLFGGVAIGLIAAIGWAARRRR